MEELKRGSAQELNALRKMISECEKMARFSWLHLDVRGVEADEKMLEAASAACGYQSKGIGTRKLSGRFGSSNAENLIGVSCLGEKVREVVAHAAATNTHQGQALAQSVADLELLRAELPVLQASLSESEKHLSERKAELEVAKSELKKKQGELDRLCGVNLEEGISLTIEECEEISEIHKVGMAKLVERREELRQQEVAALEAEKRKAEIQNLCTVCCTEQLDTVFMPCMHLCCCSKCAGEAEV